MLACLFKECFNVLTSIPTYILEHMSKNMDTRYKCGMVIENIVAKGSIAHCNQCLLFLLYLQKSSVADVSKCICQCERVNSISASLQYFLAELPLLRCLTITVKLLYRHITERKEGKRLLLLKLRDRSSVFCFFQNCLNDKQ